MMLPRQAISSVSNDAHLQNKPDALAIRGVHYFQGRSPAGYGIVSVIVRKAVAV